MIFDQRRKFSHTDSHRKLNFPCFPANPLQNQLMKTLPIAALIASGFAAHADEAKLSGLACGVTETTISGYVDAAAQFSTTVDPLVPSSAFSPTVVPEPTTLALLAGGVVTLFASRRLPQVVTNSNKRTVQIDIK